MLERLEALERQIIARRRAGQYDASFEKMIRRHDDMQAALLNDLIDAARKSGDGGELVAFIGHLSKYDRESVGVNRQSAPEDAAGRGLLR
jgi:hypothetical protein